MFKVKGTNVYIAGSLHVLPKDDHALPKEFWDAHKQSRHIYLEAVGKLPKKIILQEGVSRTRRDNLTEQLSVEDLLKADRVWRKSGGALPLKAIKPWLARLVLIEKNLTESGFSADKGVEAQVKKRSRFTFKRVKGLESLNFQVRMLISQPLDAQVTAFTKYMNEYDSGQASTDLKDKHQAFKHNDLGALGRLNQKSKKDGDSDILKTTERNAAWVPQIETAINKKQKALVVVGVLHCVGDDSVVRMLEDKGYELDRVY
jgi:uncharacterized protein